MLSIKVIGAVRPDQSFGGMAGHFDITTKYHPSVKIPDTHLLRTGFHGENISIKRVLGSGFWVLRERQ